MSELGLHYDPFGRLVLTLPEGPVHVGVVPVRCFPFSAPDEWVSFCDEQGREVYCLPDLGVLPPEVRTRLTGDLAQREFIPVITRVHAVSSGPVPVSWHVETDRGEARFTLTSEDSIRRLGPRGALISDAHSIRYRILDAGALDAHSRRILDRYL